MKEDRIGAQGAHGCRKESLIARARLYRRLFMLHWYDPKTPGARFRLSQKLRYNDSATDEVFVEALGAAAVIYRTDLARKQNRTPASRVSSTNARK